MSLDTRDLAVPDTFDSAAELDAHELLRALIRAVCVASRPTLSTNGDGRGDVVLDAIVDGVRGVLSLTCVDGSHKALSPREYEIARLIARGHTNKTVATVLGISVWTVSTHVRRIFMKLDVTTRAAMVARFASLATPAEA